MITLRAPFAYDVDQASLDAGLANDLPSLTQQSFAEDADINTIVERFGLTGQLPEALPPQYGDFSGVVDFQTAMNAVRVAGEGFMTLPAQLRARFENDPSRLISFLEDPGNRDEAISLGLVNKPEVVGKVLSNDPPPKAE